MLLGFWKSKAVYVYFILNVSLIQLVVRTAQLPYKPVPINIQGNHHASAKKTKQTGLHQAQRVLPNDIGMHHRQATGKHYKRTYIVVLNGDI